MSHILVTKVGRSVIDHIYINIHIAVPLLPYQAYTHHITIVDHFTTWLNEIFLKATSTVM